jgi:hypothetical protein
LAFKNLLYFEGEVRQQSAQFAPPLPWLDSSTVLRYYEFGHGPYDCASKGESLLK